MIFHLDARLGNRIGDLLLGPGFDPGREAIENALRQARQG
jgi:hypothetical protein